MADAEDLKSSGDFSSCGFDSHPGHHHFKALGMFEALRRASKSGFTVPLHFALYRSNLSSSSRRWCLVRAPTFPEDVLRLLAGWYTP